MLQYDLVDPLDRPIVYREFNNPAARFVKNHRRFVIRSPAHRYRLYVTVAPARRHGVHGIDTELENFPPGYALNRSGDLTGIQDGVRLPIRTGIGSFGEALFPEGFPLPRGPRRWKWRREHGAEFFDNPRPVLKKRQVPG